jgi:hypothetical protein
MQQQTFSTEDEQTIGESSWQEVDEDLSIQSIDPSTRHQQVQKTLHDAGTRAHWHRVRSLQRKRGKDIAIIAERCKEAIARHRCPKGWFASCNPTRGKLELK